MNDLTLVRAIGTGIYIATGPCDGPPDIRTPNMEVTRRIVACVNACEGLTNEFLEQVPVKLDGRKKGYAGV